MTANRHSEEEMKLNASFVINLVTMHVNDQRKETQEEMKKRTRRKKEGGKTFFFRKSGIKLKESYSSGREND